MPARATVYPAADWEESGNGVPMDRSVPRGGGGGTLPGPHSATGEAAAPGGVVRYGGAADDVTRPGRVQPLDRPGGGGKVPGIEDLGAPDLEGARLRTAPASDVPAADRPEHRRDSPGPRPAVPRPAAELGGALHGRAVADSGAGACATSGPSAAQPPGHAHARPRPPRGHQPLPNDAGSRRACCTRGCRTSGMRRACWSC